MKFVDEPVLSAGFFVDVATAESCRVRLGSCLPDCPGEEISVPVAPADVEWVSRLRAGQLVWVVYRGGAVVGLELRPSRSV